MQHDFTLMFESPFGIKLWLRRWTLDLGLSIMDWTLVIRVIYGWSQILTYLLITINWVYSYIILVPGLQACLIE